MGTRRQVVVEVVIFVETLPASSCRYQQKPCSRKETQQAASLRKVGARSRVASLPARGGL